MGVNDADFKMNEVPQWAEDRAKSIVSPDETIIAIYTISEQNRRNAVRQPLLPALCPLFWPVMILGGPCIYATMSVENTILKSTIYIVTDKRLYRSIDPGEVGSNCLYTPGRDSGSVALEDITGMYIDNPSRVLGTKVLPLRQLIINLPMGHPLAQELPRDRSENGPSIRTSMIMLVDDPAEVIAVLRKAKEEKHNKPQQVVFSNGSAPENDEYSALKKLKELLDAGIITKAEYEEKRKAHVNNI